MKSHSRSTVFILRTFVFCFDRKPTLQWLLWPSLWYERRWSTSPNPSCLWESLSWSRSLRNPNQVSSLSWIHWLTRSGCVLFLPTSVSVWCCSWSAASVRMSGTPRSMKMGRSRPMSRPTSLAYSTACGSPLVPLCDKAVTSHLGNWLPCLPWFN